MGASAEPTQEEIVALIDGTQKSEPVIMTLRLPWFYRYCLLIKNRFFRYARQETKKYKEDPSYENMDRLTWIYDYEDVQNELRLRNEIFMAELISIGGANNAFGPDPASRRKFNDRWHIGYPFRWAISVGHDDRKNVIRIEIPTSLMRSTRKTLAKILKHLDGKFEQHDNESLLAETVMNLKEILAATAPPETFRPVDIEGFGKLLLHQTSVNGTLDKYSKRLAKKGKDTSKFALSEEDPIVEELRQAGINLLVPDRKNSMAYYRGLIRLHDEERALGDAFDKKAVVKRGDAGDVRTVETQLKRATEIIQSGLPGTPGFPTQLKTYEYTASPIFMLTLPD